MRSIPRPRVAENTWEKLFATLAQCLLHLSTALPPADPWYYTFNLGLLVAFKADREFL